jgi:hypothetical protein
MSEESLSPAEAAYFSSKGSDTSGLEAEFAQGDSQAGDSVQGGNPTPSAQTGFSGGPEGQEQPLGEDDGEEVIIVGKDGKPRAQGSGRFVPHQALHKERERRKSVETELGTYREKMARADERMAVLNEILGKEEPAARASAAGVEQEIDPSVDPLGALTQAYAKIKALESKVNETASQQQERENSRAMLSAYQNDAARFVREKPEFQHAYSYLFEGRHRELEAMGMTDQAERNRFIANEERQIVSSAIQGRRSPAQMLYNLAVARGFSHAPAAPQQNDAQRLEHLAKAQRVAGSSLSSAGGTSGEGLTPAALANMSEEEFATVAAKLGKAKLRQLMGG